MPPWEKYQQQSQPVSTPDAQPQQSGPWMKYVQPAQTADPQQPSQDQGVTIKDFFTKGVPRFGQQLYQGAKSLFALPHDVYTGQADLNKPEDFARAQQLGMAITPMARFPLAGKATGAAAKMDEAAPKAEPQALGAAAAPPQTPPSLAPTDQPSMKGLLRQRYGLAKRDIEQQATTLEPYRKELNKAPPGAADAVVDYVENPTPQGRAALPPQIQELADRFATASANERDKFQRVYALSGMDFIKDYYPHLYKQDAALEAFLGRELEERGPGFGAQGSAALTKKRTMFPTMAEARAAGISPRYDNPIDMILASYRQKSNFVAAHEVKEAMQEAGTLRYPQYPPQGWAPIQGRFARNAGGVQGYAPEPIARAYNTWISSPWKPGGKLGTVAETLDEINNAAKSMKFGLSGHHAVTTLTENFGRSVGAAIENLAAGRPGGVARALADVAGAGPWVRGHRGLKIYSGMIKGTPEEEELVSILSQANPALTGVGQDWRYAGGESFGQMVKRGSMGKAWEQWKRELGESYAQSLAQAGGKVASGVLHTFQRTIDATTAPIFDELVPQIKFGNNLRDMGNWLKSNPGATREQTLAAARKIVDHSDDVFGEMQRDNLFWNKTFMKGADAILLSPTYTFGSFRGLGGGILNLGKKGVMTAIGKGGEAPAFSPASPNYQPNMGYAAGLAASTVAINAVAQKLMTGQWPQRPWDIVAPRTGGETISAPGTKYERVHPEVLAPFGNIKEVYDIAKDVGALGGAPQPFEYPRSKLTPFAETAVELGSNKDYRDKPIMRPLGKGAFTDAVKDIAKNVAPISISSFVSHETEPKYAKSAIPWWLSFLGYRPGGMQLYDPEGFRGMMNKKARKEKQK